MGGFITVSREPDDEDEIDEEDANQTGDEGARNITQPDESITAHPVNAPSVPTQWRSTQCGFGYPVPVPVWLQIALSVVHFCAVVGGLAWLGRCLQSRLKRGWSVTQAE